MSCSATTLTKAPSCTCCDAPMGWNRDKRRTGGGFWYCRSKRRKTFRQWYKEHGAEHNRRCHQAKLRWAREHPELKTQASRIRRARLARVDSDKHSRLEVWARDAGVCQICRAELSFHSWHEDHITPISKGGTDTLDNVQATCPPCNLHKAANGDLRVR